jgi:hypothetical protein
VSEVIGEVDAVPGGGTAFLSCACFNDEQDEEQFVMPLSGSARRFGRRPAMSS